MTRWYLVLPLLAQGCYLSHPIDELFRPDGGPPRDGASPPDASGLDGAVPDGSSDGGLDAGTDGGTDAGPDAQVIGRDAEPPIGPPPDPTRCRIEPEVFPFTDPVVEYRWPSGPMAHMSERHVCSTPLVVDLDTTDDDPTPRLVFPSYLALRGEERGILRIVNPRTNETLSYPPSNGELGVIEPTTNLAAGDLDGDGLVEILALGVFSGTYAFRHDGSLLWESPYPIARDRGLRWARTIGGAISLADLEGDGTVEVVAGRAVLDGLDGSLRFLGDLETTTRGANGILGPISCVADLDGDGRQEVVSGRTAQRSDGTLMWNNTALPDGLCAIANVFPATSDPEVVLASSGYVYVLEGRTGAELWARVLEGGGAQSLGGAPTVADFDGDGRPEIGIAHASAYAVYDVECVARNRPAGCAAPGLLWSQPTSDASSAATGSSVFDFNGDGRAEVAYNDEQYFRVYDGRTGRALFQSRNSSRTRTENPVIADVDNDGDAEIVFSANAEANFLQEYWTEPGVFVWGDARGRWVGARRIWNQHAYHITNVDEQGRIASPETPSWTVLNAYRQNLREGGDVLVVPDLWGGRGSYECVAAGRARLRVNVQNWGLERVGAGTVVSFYRGRPSEGMRVGEARTTRVLEPRGDSELVELEVMLSGEVVDYWAVLDDPIEPMGGAVAECRETNNEVLIWRPACP